MISITIKGLSKEAHQALKERAVTHGRSLNREAIAVLESSVRSAPVDAQAMIARMRAIRPRPKRNLSAGQIREAIREGRM